MDLSMKIGATCRLFFIASGRRLSGMKNSSENVSQVVRPVRRRWRERQPQHSPVKCRAGPSGLWVHASPYG